MTRRPDPYDEPIDVEQVIRDFDDIIAAGDSPFDVFNRTSPASTGWLDELLAREDAKRKAEEPPEPPSGTAKR